MPPPSLSDPWLTSRRFAVIIDAGSSGSRVQVYSWKDPEAVRLTATESTDLHILPTVEKGTKNDNLWQLKIEPGLSHFSSRPDSISGYLKVLIQHAEDQIPPSLHRQTPIFLYATAGMRLLTSSQQQVVLDTACDVVKKHSTFALEGSVTDTARCGNSVRVISGEEEGVFGWIALNYLMNRFMPPDSNQSPPPAYGFLDMGGASTQMAFEPLANSTSTSSKHLTNVELRLLDGQRIERGVFAASWLGFGTNEARARYLKHAARDWLDQRRHSPNAAHAGTDSYISSIHIEDPCLPRNLELHTSYYNPSSTTSGASSGDTIPVVVSGTGSYRKCLKATSPFVEKDAPCDTGPCLFGGVHAPPIDFLHHRFVGISEYWYSSQHVFGLGGVFDFEKYEAAAEEFCGTEWGSLLQKHLKVEDSAQAHEDLRRLEMQCFKAAWIVNVLGDGIGIPRTDAGWKTADGDANQQLDEKKVHNLGLDAAFRSIDTVDGTAVRWTLGKMLLEATKDIPEYPPNLQPPRQSDTIAATNTHIHPLTSARILPRLLTLLPYIVVATVLIGATLKMALSRRRRRRSF